MEFDIDKKYDNLPRYLKHKHPEKNKLINN